MSRPFAPFCMILGLSLAGCAGHASAPPASSETSGATALAVPGVKIVPGGPGIETGGVLVTGTSCKSSMFQSDPTKDDAMARMERAAAAQGFDSIHAVSVQDGPSDGCLSAIRAQGIAFNAAKVAAATPHPEVKTYVPLPAAAKPAPANP